MKINFVFIILIIANYSVLSQNKVNFCDSLNLFFHGREICLSKENEIYKCGLVLTQRKISPAIFYYHYKYTDDKWLLLKKSVYYSKNIDFINNIVFVFLDNFMVITFSTKSGEKKYWKLPLSKKLNLKKELSKIEKLLSIELIKFQDNN